MPWHDAKQEMPAEGALIATYDATGSFGVSVWRGGVLVVSPGTRLSYDEILAWHPLDPLPGQFADQ